MSQSRRLRSWSAAMAATERTLAAGLTWFRLAGGNGRGPGRYRGRGLIFWAGARSVSEEIAMITTRRTVLKAIAAALMAPTIRLRPEIDREALMRPFCDVDEGYRYQLNAPFQQGSLTYCTDSRRIIRAELTCPEVVGERRLPDAAGLWNHYWRNGQLRPVERPQISELLLPRGKDRDGVCPKCLGRRISLGDFYPYSDDKLVNYDPDDNSVGDESCELCHGLSYYGPSQVEIGGFRFSYHMLAPMYDLPGVMVRPPTNNEDDPMLFKADGFEGMVMPLHG